LARRFEKARRGAVYGRKKKVEPSKSLYFWYIFRYKNGGCIENDYCAVSGPSGASDCRDSFVSRCRITLVPQGEAVRTGAFFIG
jgi:hypothetical protein